MSIVEPSIKINFFSLEQSCEELLDVYLLSGAEPDLVPTPCEDLLVIHQGDQPLRDLHKVQILKTPNKSDTHFTPTHKIFCMLVSSDRGNSSSCSISSYSTLFSPFCVVFLYTCSTQPNLFVVCLHNNQYLVFFHSTYVYCLFQVDPRTGWVLTSLIKNKGDTFTESEDISF